MNAANGRNGNRVLSIPRISGDPLSIAFREGQRLFIVGANGSGKSALLQHIVGLDVLEPLFRIPAFRSTSLHSSSVEMTGSGRESFVQQNIYQERELSALWREWDPVRSQAVLLFDLVDHENRRNQTLARHVDERDMQKAERFAAKHPSPFSRLNELLSVAAISISIEISKSQKILAKRNDFNASFGIEQMSDGERNAVLIAARVLTVETGTAVLIDEPERHLHRAIIEPFLSALFAERKDCTFIVSTHEIALPAAHPDADVLIVHSVEWKSDAPNAWRIDHLKPEIGVPEHERIPEALRLAILGSRKKILFVEGAPDSIDEPLYTVLFPDVSVIPVGSCGEVIRSVKGLREASALHNAEAFGLIDNDGRSIEEIESFARQSIFALDVWSAESLYYCSAAIAAVATRRAEDLQKSADDMSKTAVEAALRTLNEKKIKEHMAARRCHNRIRRETSEKLPKWQEIMNDSYSPPVCVNVNKIYHKELGRFEMLVADKDLDGLISRYPLRHSPAFGKIAKALHFPNKKDYERTVVSRIRADNKLAQSLRDRIELLSDALGYSCE